MRYKQLGATPFVVSEIGFGGFGIGGSVSGNSYGATSDAESMRAIETALELGCTFFDTADVYGFGHSETLLGRTLGCTTAGRAAVLATKVGGRVEGGLVRKDFSSGYIRTAVEASLRRLRRDAIDLYQLHDPSLNDLESGEALDCLGELVRSGKIRSYGVSIHSVDEASCAVRHKGTETVQAAVNLVSLVDPERRLERLLDVVQRSGVGLIAREPLASGFLSGRHSEETQYDVGDVRAGWTTSRRLAYLALYRTFSSSLAPGVLPAQAALRFVIDQPGVSTTIVGIKTVAQAEVNFGAADLPAFESLLSESQY